MPALTAFNFLSGVGRELTKAVSLPGRKVQAAFVEFFAFNRFLSPSKWSSLWIGRRQPRIGGEAFCAKFDASGIF
jgi:hypothetical protein